MKIFNNVYQIVVLYFWTRNINSEGKGNCVQENIRYRYEWYKNESQLSFKFHFSFFPPPSYTSRSRYKWNTISLILLIFHDLVAIFQFLGGSSHNLSGSKILLPGLWFRHEFVFCYWACYNEHNNVFRMFALKRY